MVTVCCFYCAREVTDIVRYGDGWGTHAVAAACVHSPCSCECFPRRRPCRLPPPEPPPEPPPLLRTCSAPPARRQSCPSLRKLLPVCSKKSACEVKKRRRLKRVRHATFSNVCKVAPRHLSQFAQALFDYLSEVGKLISCEADTRVCGTLKELMRVVAVLGHDVCILFKCLCRSFRRLNSKRVRIC